MKNLTENIGKHYAHGLLIYSQIAVIVSIGTSIMTAGTFYAVVLRFYIPLWLFIAIVIICLALFILFVIKIGIPAYYKITRRLLNIDNIETAINEGGKIAVTDNNTK